MKITKTSGGSDWNSTIIGDQILKENFVNKWKIKILSNINTSEIYWGIFIVVGPYD